MRDAVSDKLNSLMDDDIIENVSSPTPWASPIVCAPKPNNPDEICLCGYEVGEHRDTTDAPPNSYNQKNHRGCKWCQMVLQTKPKPKISLAKTISKEQAFHNIYN